MTGLDERAAGTATSISMIFLSAVLTGLSLYDNIAKVAGAGTIVPITGFRRAGHRLRDSRKCDLWRDPSNSRSGVSQAVFI